MLETALPAVQRHMPEDTNPVILVVMKHTLRYEYNFISFFKRKRYSVVHDFVTSLQS